MIEKLTEVFTNLKDLVAPAVVAIKGEANPDGKGGTILIVRNGYEAEAFHGPVVAYRDHTFDDVETFAAFLGDRYEGRPKAVDILVGEREITTSIDTGRQYRDRVRCVLQEHPQFTGWVELTERGPMSAEDIYRLIQGLRETIQPWEGAEGKPVDAADAICSALLQVNIVTGSECKIVMDKSGVQRVMGQAGEQTVNSQLPPMFTVEVPIYQGITGEEGADVEEVGELTYAIDLLLQVRPGREGGAVFNLVVASNLETMRHQARRDVATFLRRKLGDDWLVGLGRAGSHDAADR